MALALGLGVACRGSSGDDDGVTPDGGGNGDGGGPTTIYDIQMGKVNVGTQVKLDNVIVTAVDGYGGNVGSFWVEEQAGGAYSGVLVAKTALPSGVVEGDIVSLTGAVVDEDHYTTDMSGRTVTRLVPLDGGAITVTKTGTGTVPAPAVVDAVAMAASDDEAEKWEGVLITVQNVAVVSAPKGISMNDPLQKAAKITGPFQVTSSMSALSVGGTELKLDDCLVSLTGVVDYFVQFQLLPRRESDIVGGGTSCPAKENSAGLCGDQMDNDHNGFTDCGDFSCQSVQGVDCTTTTTVVNIQNGTVKAGTFVKLSNVVITAIHVAANDDRVWVADAATAAPYNGIMVLKPQGGVAGLAVGDVVDVIGYADEYFNLTEIKNVLQTFPTITKKSSGSAPTAVVVPVATMADATMAEPYEGVLITVSNVKVTSLNPDATDHGEYVVSIGAANLRVDDFNFQSRTGKNLNDCLSITGVVDFAFNNFKLLPRSAADVVAGAGCQ